MRFLNFAAFRACKLIKERERNQVLFSHFDHFWFCVLLIKNGLENLNIRYKSPEIIPSSVENRNLSSFFLFIVCYRLLKGKCNVQWKIFPPHELSWLVDVFEVEKSKNWILRTKAWKFNGWNHPFFCKLILKIRPLAESGKFYHLLFWLVITRTYGLENLHIS